MMNDDQAMIDDLVAALYAHCTVDELRELAEAVGQPALGVDPVGSLTELAAACLGTASPLPEPVQALVDGVRQPPAPDPDKDVRLLAALLQNDPTAVPRAVVHLLHIAAGQACLLGMLQALLQAKGLLTQADVDEAARLDSFDEAQRRVLRQLVGELNAQLADEGGARQ